MTRSIKDTKKIYLEGKTEYSFIFHVLQITGNVEKFQRFNLGGGSHTSMINKALSDLFVGEKICIIDNSNRAKGQIPLLENNQKLLDEAVTGRIRLIISKNQFEDEIIDFLGVPKVSGKNSKENVHLFLKLKNMEWSEFVKMKIKNKTYIRDNIDKIKNEGFKNILLEIVDSHKKDIYQ